MKKRDKKLVKKAGERKTLHREFKNFKAAWQFLCGHLALRELAVCNPFISPSDDKKGYVLWVSLKLKNERDVSYEAKTFEEAIIGIANKVLKEYGPA